MMSVLNLKWILKQSWNKNEEKSHVCGVSERFTDYVHT